MIYNYCVDVKRFPQGHPPECRVGTTSTNGEREIGELIAKAIEKRQRSLLIVAEDVESDALATLILDKLHAGIKVCAIKDPGFGENRKASLHDLFVLTGGDVRIISVFFYDVLLIHLNFLFYG
ncbi:hypothetical protein Taro_041722 [Colocasia esculenta]|uniref:Xyloglucan endo-transglycosylase C-terminal domain-containing protein n=1 Tax=Colocasia esculenta TaxID=4460 RepID=A0A843X133_COLES|nr:hypothetical protein [Colocasia esculenta]